MRARALYSAGFRTVRSIANARPEDLVRAIPKLGMFTELSSTNFFAGNFGVHAAKMIVSSAKKLLEDKASELRREAEEMLKAENEVGGEDPGEFL